MMMTGELYIAGIGMGHTGGMTLEVKDAILKASLLVGGSRMLSSIPEEWKAGKTCIPIWKPEEIADILAHETCSVAAALMSGDSGFNSGTGHLISELSRRGMVVRVNGTALKETERETEHTGLSIWVYPGVGSISTLAAKAGIGWEEAVHVSLHGRSQNLFSALAQGKKVFVLSGSKTDEVMRNLKGSVFCRSEVFIGERMGAMGERFLRLRAEAYEKDSFDPMTTMLILPETERPVRLLGMADDLFVRGKVPMTKSEVRSLSVSRLAPGRSDVVYDIGAGTGSVSVELSMQAMYGRVFAIERRPEALELIRANREKFFCRNLEIVEGTAPEILAELPRPDAAFIGGSGGAMREILHSLKRMNSRIRVVINAVSPETLTETLSALRELAFSEVECSQISVARAEAHGGLHLMKAENPVYVISAAGGE